MKNVFVSYSHRDMEFARKLVGWLEEKGYTVWMDKKRILAGANYLESIAEGIGKADAFIPLLSPESVSSKWVAREIIYALEHDKAIIPVLVQFAEIPDALKFAITGLHHVDFTETDESVDPWHALEKALQGSQNSNEFKDTPGKATADTGKPTQTANEQFLSYIQQQRKRTSVIGIGILAAMVVLIIGVGFLLLQNRSSGNGQQGQNEGIRVVVETPQQGGSRQPAEGIRIAGVSGGIENTLRIAYSGEIRDAAAPSAAVGVIVQPGADPAVPWRPLRDGEPLSSRDNYRIVFQPEQKAYLYVFQIDSTGKLDWIFPKNASSTYSDGANPVPAGVWSQIPQGEEAFHLDENLGIEHIYIVTTAVRWEALEKSLMKSCKAKAVALKKPLQLKTRGIGGTRLATPSMPGRIKMSLKEVQQMITGKNGVLVKEIWFQHVAP